MDHEWNEERLKDCFHYRFDELKFCFLKYIYIYDNKFKFYSLVSLYYIFEYIIKCILQFNRKL